MPTTDSAPGSQGALREVNGWGIAVVFPGDRTSEGGLHSLPWTVVKAVCLPVSADP